MKKYLMAGVALIATALLPATSEAMGDGFYAGVQGGADWEKLEQATKNDLGFDAGLTLGYKVDCWRLEAEGMYRQHNYKTDQLPIGPTIDLKTRTYTAMGNLLFDIDCGKEFVPYIGAGAGYARVDDKATSGPVTIRTRENKFAYQGIAGVSFPITCDVEAGVQYRFFKLHETDSQWNQSAELALRYGF